MIRLKKLLEDIPLGNVAFGENPKAAKFQNAETETNTTAEQELYKLLQKWFAGPVSGTQGNFTGRISNELTDLRSDLFKLKQEFPNVFDVPDNIKIAYRGSNIDNETRHIYDYLTNNSTVYIVNRHGRHYGEPVIVVPYIYAPSSNVQSGTSEQTVAETIAPTGIFKLVLVTKVDDSFLMNPAFSNVISNLRESEMLHFGKNIKTYLSIGSYHGRLFQTAYEVLKGYHMGALNDDDETNFTEKVMSEYKSNPKFKVVDSYEKLPW